MQEMREVYRIDRIVMLSYRDREFDWRMEIGTVADLRMSS